MKNILKKVREEKKVLIKELAQELGVDASLVSRFESGERKPSRNQITQIADFLGVDSRKLLIEWLSENMILEYGYNNITLEAMILAESKIEYGLKKINENPDEIQNLLNEIELYKSKIEALRHLNSYKIQQALELEYTFESNRIEGNTMTLKETDLVINEGITISGKSMREHLEAINHNDAIDYVKELIDRKSDFKERDLLQLHYLILKGIDSPNAGKYRSVQVMIKGSQHLPPQPYLVKKQMEDLFIWFNANKNILHPVLLAAEMSERLVTIHPFIDGNGRTSRLVMNLILLKHGYVIANIKGDNESRSKYYSHLESVQIGGEKVKYHHFIALCEIDALKRYAKILGINTD